MTVIQCEYCCRFSEKKSGAVNRSIRAGAPLYCNRECAGLARRLDRTDEEWKAAKAAYDLKRRATLDAEAVKRAKAEYYQRTRDPVKEAAIRKSRMHLHVAYCQRPEYVAKKAVYDQRRRDRLKFGEFAEAAALLRDVEKEVDSQASRYEIYQQNGTLNKAQTRRRAL